MIAEAVSTLGEARCRPLLEPRALDRLPLLGAGFAGQVRRAGRFAIKIAHCSEESRRRVREELDLLRSLQDLEGLLVPRLRAWRVDGTAFVRDLVPGPRVLDLLRAGCGRLEKGVFEALWESYQLAEGIRRDRELVLDFSPANLLLDRRGRVLLADVGLRLAEYPFADLSKAELKRELARYLRLRAQIEGPARLHPVLLPPSGRFHLEVGVGPVPGARVLWRNAGLACRLGLCWSERMILHAANLATHAERKTRQAVSTRYQDSPDPWEGGAKGDGRSIYLGEAGRGAYGRCELTLKGCGPTPLAWRGHQYHEDGFVSFNRTLWEASIADELSRLEFETPEVLAILSTGQTTVDNTERRWPAAAAVRVASTHLRLGHVTLWQQDRDAMVGLLAHAGARLFRRDFRPERAGDLGALVNGFAQNLGWDTGRTDALNVHCFNPTLGNVRLDGHFIDFSTVRLLRHHTPGFPYLNDTLAVRGHRIQWRCFVRHFIEPLNTVGLLQARAARALSVKALRSFDERYLEGYLDGLSRFLGIAAPPTVATHGRRLCRALVARTRKLRSLRAAELLRFPFWKKQGCVAPLFDLEGRSPLLVERWRAGDGQAWRALRSGFEGAMGPDDEEVARGWFSLLVRSFDPRGLRPRRWDQVIRPFMEAEQLADLCYRRSCPEQLEEWKRLIRRD